MNYSFNFLNYINLLFPTFLRKEKMIAWLFTLIKPCKEIHEKEFLPLVAQLKEDLKYTSDTEVVEYMLRKKLFGASPKVFIRNFNEQYPDVIIGREDDQRYELVIGRGNEFLVSLYRQDPVSSLGLDFEVIVDNSEKPLSFDMKARLKTLIDNFKIGRRYRIIFQDTELIYQTEKI